MTETASSPSAATPGVDPELAEMLTHILTLYLRQPAPDATLTYLGEHILASPRSALDD